MTYAIHYASETGTGTEMVTAPDMCAARRMFLAENPRCWIESVSLLAVAA
jgi:hypothetical protein